MTSARVVLDNGLVILVRENHAAPVAVLEGALPAGSIHTAREQAGLAGFVASMAMRGSEHYDFDAFNERIEGVGASLSVSADEHTTDFGSTSLAEDFPNMVELLADILRRPTFPTEHVERVRSQRLVRIQERDQDTQQVASLRFYEADLRRSSLRHVRPGLRRQRSAHSTPRLDRIPLPPDTHRTALAIVVTGDVETDRVVDLIPRALRGLAGPTADQTVPPIHGYPAPHGLRIALPDKVQADIVLGCPAISRHHPDFHPVRVANTILGRFGMMGRLGENVRGGAGACLLCLQHPGRHPGRRRLDGQRRASTRPMWT